MSLQSPSPPARMTVTEFLLWARDKPHRHDLIGGIVFAQASERAAHWTVKFNVQRSLLTAVRAGHLPCHVVPDGATVVIDDHTAFEPDALVYCGDPVAPSSLVVENPVIIVEVVSPSSGRNDEVIKLADYFRLESVRHYLIVHPDERLVIHHERHEGGTIVAHIVRDGMLTFDPPGFAVSLGDFYGDGDP